MKFSEYKRKKLAADEELRKEYYKKIPDYDFEVSNLITEARLFAGLTQEELARRVGTKQPSIARAENGSSLASHGLLKRVAKAIGTYLVPPKFGFMVEIKVNIVNTSFGEVREDAPVKSPYPYFLEDNPSSNSISLDQRSDQDKFSAFTS